MTAISRKREVHDAVVTVVVPAKNEERDIERCLDAIGAQDYRRDLMEVLVVDGASSDRTVAVAEAAFARLGLARARVISNPRGSTPSNLNTGLEHATGEIIVRVDARSLIPTDYVSRCVELLTSLPEVAVVGGAQVAVPPTGGPLGTGIARGLNNKWGMGLSRYRRGAASGPADTVYLGTFRAADLRQVGGWDERLPTNQDFDLNRRLSHLGVVWFDSELAVGYVPRSSLVALFRQYRRFGQWKVRYWRMTGDRPRGRQLALLLTPVGGVATLAVGLSKPGWRVPVLAGVATAGVAVELLGSERPATSSPSAHAAALGALTMVASGWLSGVWTELLHRNHE